MRHLMILGLLILSLVAPLPAAHAQAGVDELPTDLAAMLPSGAEIGDDRIQFARGGYLGVEEARYLIAERYDAGEEALGSVLGGIEWVQSYDATLVLLADRAIRTSDPVMSHTYTIHELGSADEATVLLSLLSSSPPDPAEEQPAAIEGATTWRTVTSQDDTLHSVVATGAFVFEVESAHRRLTPDADGHAAAVEAVLDRVDDVVDGIAPNLSQRMVLVQDDRLVPVAVPTDVPLAHTWYRLIDGSMVLAAGEMEFEPPLPDGVTDVAIARQTAEISSQNWATVGVVIAEFASSSDAEAAIGTPIKDPLDRFFTTESLSGELTIPEEGSMVQPISGETRVGGRFSGYRVTVQESDRIAWMTVRSMGSTVFDRESVELWALLQAECLATGACSDVALTDVLPEHEPSQGTPGTEDELGVYDSDVAPWRITYDTSVWQESDRFAEGGYDYLYLRSDRMDATFESIVNHHGDAEQCVLDELDRLRDVESGSYITVGSDDPDARAGGLDNGHAWIVYTVEPLAEQRVDEQYTIRIDCHTVVDGSTSLVVQTWAPRDVWPEIAGMSDDLRAGIEIDGTSAGGTTGGPLQVRPTWRSDAMINRRPWTGLVA